MWLFHHKYLAYGTLSRYKARLVANGSTELEGVNVDETFSQVVKSGTIRTVLSLAASRHWPIHQLDVKNAFLHGDLSKTVYMYQPPGFWDFVYPDYGTNTAYLLLYMDDIVLTASYEGLLQRIIHSLHQEESTYDNCKPSQTPVDTETKQGVVGDPVSDLTLYQSLAGSLKYLTFTRPDISYAVQLVCLHMHDPWEPYLSAIKRILRDRLQEYRDVANAVTETCWLRNLLLQHQRTKYIENNIHFVRDLVAAGQVRVLHVPSRYQFVDIFTKGLSSASFEEFHSSLSCEVSESNVRRIQVKDIVKEVEDYLKTYSSAGIDISTVPPIPPPFGASSGNPGSPNVNRVDTMPTTADPLNTTTTTNVAQSVADENLPQLLDSRGGTHVTNVPAFDKEEFMSWKVRFSVFFDGIEPYLLKTLFKTAKEIWNDFILAHEGPFDTRDTKIAALRLKFNAFKSLKGEKVLGTFTRLKCLLNNLENNGVTIPQAEVNATFDSDSNAEEDQRTSNEFMVDLNAEIDDLTKGKSEKGKIDKGKSEKGLIAESFDWDEEYVSSEDEGTTRIRAFMAIAKDEPLVGKADARSGQWVDITMKKDQRKNMVNKYNLFKQELSLHKSEQSNLKNIVSINCSLQKEVIRVNLENESLKDEITELKNVIEKWTCSKVTLDQLLSEQIPGNIVKDLGGKGRIKENNLSKKVLFTKADISTSESAPMITSNSEDDNDIKEPLPPLPKLTEADPASASKSLISLSDLTANMADLTLNTASKEIKKSSNKVSQTYIIKKRTESKHPTIQNACHDKNALPSAE
ncbi:ribonuclease H-like domain-containing protein, partial [Tanacetum coccineum]